MNIAPLRISQLLLNPHNDRHGPLKDEASAIQWLLENRAVHMRALSHDLVSTKRLYERPLVRPDGGSNYIVFDGNRRTCCIKLLIDPTLAHTEKWQEFFTEIASPDAVRAFSEIECEIEPDLEIIDDTLFRRHTGSQDGVGQSQWDAEGKSFFLHRTGKASIGLGESIERALKAEQLISADTSLPWSNLERLFSSETTRKRAGFSFSGGSLTYLTDKKQNLQTLQRIAEDLTRKDSRKISLEDLWNNQKKARYLDRLKSEGVAIDIATSSSSGSQAKRAAIEDTTRPKPRGRAPQEKNLISRADQNPFMPFPELERAEKIWRELQFTLEFDSHDNAIAVLMRVLLEQAIVNYARKQGVVFSQNDSLARRVSAVADSMLNRGFIDAKGRSIIRKFESDKPIVSAHSMHQYIHHSSFHPSRSDMKSIWNVIRPLIVNSVR